MKKKLRNNEKYYTQIENYFEAIDALQGKKKRRKKQPFFHRPSGNEAIPYHNLSYRSYEFCFFEYENIVYCGVLSRSPSLSCIPCVDPFISSLFSLPLIVFCYFFSIFLFYSHFYCLLLFESRSCWFLSFSQWAMNLLHVFVYT